MVAEDIDPNDAAPAVATEKNAATKEDDLFGDDDAAAVAQQQQSAANTAENNEDGTQHRSTTLILKSNPPPNPLPIGWYLKPSISSPGNFYYFHQDTGLCQWEYSQVAQQATAAQSQVAAAQVSQETLNATAAAAADAVKSILKREDSGVVTGDDGKSTEKRPADDKSPSPRKRIKTSDSSSTKDLRRSGSKDKSRDRHHVSSGHHSSSNTKEPKEVRVLHILKKHAQSRRPASWRNPKITDSKEKSISDLNELRSILQEQDDSGNFKELRATFEELAKTESDCSSAKRGGDLGFFGKKKMQPAFEKASFGLRVGELSDVVDTSSGVHIILRLA